ncbi:MAG: hypothetical protein DMG77_03190 [Acidobacteria bacterium]|nr:MAG: hypothetical protein DMG77_03190 [Acidobacteriota bacterium]
MKKSVPALYFRLNCPLMAYEIKRTSSGITKYSAMILKFDGKTTSIYKQSNFLWVRSERIITQIRVIESAQTRASGPRFQF